MSLDALRSALALERPDPKWGRTHKAVLESLADHANAAGEAFVCVATICDEKWIERKAVLAAMKDLREAGWIVDTGKRRGRTRQVVVWSLPWIDHRHKASRNRDTYADTDQRPDSNQPEDQQPQPHQQDQRPTKEAPNRNSSETGTLSERVPESSAKGPGLESKGSPNRDTEPPTGFNPLPGDNPPAEGVAAQARTPARETGDTKTAKPKGGGKVARPEFIAEQVWSDYLRFRRSKKALLTQTAWNRIEAQIRKGMDAGHDPNDMLAEAMEAGWTGFKLEWYLRRVTGDRDSSATRQPRYLD